MEKSKKRSPKKVLSKINFEEIDHRLACGWHVEVEESGQRKRYLRQVKSSNENKTDRKVSV